MKVRDLIARLEEMPQDAEVCCDTAPNSFTMEPVNTVRIAFDGESERFAGWVYIGE